MTVRQLIEELKKFNQDEEIFIWRGNGNLHFDYTSNIAVSKPYGSCDTNKGLTYNPLIITSDYKLNKQDEKSWNEKF